MIAVSVALKMVKDEKGNGGLVAVTPRFLNRFAGNYDISLLQV
jgi:hypothetical protein